MCARCRANAEGKKLPCIQCGNDTSRVGIGEWYMVSQSVWNSVAKVGDLLCIGCLELRLGRRLTPADFDGYEINIINDFPRSPRLKIRINGY